MSISICKFYFNNLVESIFNNYFILRQEFFNHPVLHTSKDHLKACDEYDRIKQVG